MTTPPPEALTLLAKIRNLVKQYDQVMNKKPQHGYVLTCPHCGEDTDTTDTEVWYDTEEITCWACCQNMGFTKVTFCLLDK